jgi:hypothetical protein
MPTFQINETHATGQTPTEADIDKIRLTIEDFFNNVKADHNNIDISSIVADLSASQADNILDKIGIADTQTATNDESDTVSSGSFQTVATVEIPVTGTYLLIAESQEILEVSNSAASTQTESIQYRFYDGTSTIGKERTTSFSITLSGGLPAGAGVFLEPFTDLGCIELASLTEGTEVEFQINPTSSISYGASNPNDVTIKAIRLGD